MAKDEKLNWGNMLCYDVFGFPKKPRKDGEICNYIMVLLVP